MMKNGILLLALMLCFTGCVQDNKQPNMEKVISNLIDKFPQLPKGTTKQTEFYRLVRTITIGETSVKLQLRSTPDSIEDKQQIVIMINSQGESYAIPFFSNTYRDYWDFQFDTPIPNVPKTNTTFEQEFNTAINTLNLKDTLGSVGKIFEELFTSLLRFRTISDSDIQCFDESFNSHSSNNSIPTEADDSCKIRFRRNFQAIKKEMYPREYWINYNAFWDAKNYRIYQVDFNSFRSQSTLKLKVYRQDCNYHIFSL